MTGDGYFVPKSTFNSVMARIKVKDDITPENSFNKQNSTLLSGDSVVVLQNIIHKRNQINNGVIRKEAIQLICDLGGTKTSKIAENYLDYLIRNGKLDKLKKEDEWCRHRQQQQKGVR